MAYSTQRAVSDGTLVYLDLAIGYQSRNDIKVFINDLPAPPGSWAWVGTTDKRISFTPAIPNGVEVLVQRTTRLDRIINVFAKGAKFTNVTMDMNFEQVLFLTQEAVEGSALSDIYNDVDFHGYKIKNLGLAVDDNEAITFGQVKSFGTGAYAAQLAAEAARDLAQAWAMHTPTMVDGVSYSAKQYALNAATSASVAAASASASQTSATNSANSASASQTSRLASEAARDAAATSRDNALASANAADVSEANALASANSAAQDAQDVADYAAIIADGPVASWAGLTGIISTAAAKTALALPTDTVTALAGKEPTIAASTTANYWRGDKTFQPLNKAAVGLSNVDNTSDAAKPISTATGTALAGKENTLGFTPVRQSTANVIQIGWSGSSMIANVDASAFGNTWPINITGNAGTLGGLGSASYVKGDVISNAGFASGSVWLPYFRNSGDNSVRYLMRNNGGCAGAARDGASINFFAEDGGFIGGVVTSGSDLRMKCDIVKSKRDALASVRKLDFIQYRYNKLARGLDTKVVHKLGFSAQNLKRIDPNYVSKGPDGMYTPVDSPLIALALKAIQELEQRVASLEAQLNK